MSRYVQISRRFYSKHHKYSQGPTRRIRKGEFVCACKHLYLNVCTPSNKTRLQPLLFFGCLTLLLQMLIAITAQTNQQCAVCTQPPPPVMIMCPISCRLLFCLLSLRRKFLIIKEKLKLERLSVISRQVLVQVFYSNSNWQCNGQKHFEI